MDPTALSDQIRSTLKLKSQEARDALAKAHPHATTFLESKNLDLSQIRDHSAKLLTAGALGGSLLLSSGNAYSQGIRLPEPIINSIIATTGGQDSTQFDQSWMSQQLNKLLPPIHSGYDLPVLSLQEEKLVGRAIEKGTGVKAVPVLEGERLNSVYGLIGAEQHLRRWPGDSIAGHGDLAHVEGMAPGNGGFGFFARGLQDLEGIEREKYYVAVQTLYLPDWNKRLKELVNWYKWRKIIVVNPDNGHAVVAVVGDAGPATWTGKIFGGSPEVMDELGGKRYKKGRVVLMFVDDPQNKVPLGPVNSLSKLNAGKIDINDLLLAQKGDN